MFSNVDAVILIILVIWIILANTLLLITIFGSSKLRGNNRNLMVASAALSDLLAGAAGWSIFADYIYLKGEWKHGCKVYIFVNALLEYCQVFIGLWGIVILSCHYLQRYLCSKHLPLSPNISSVLGIFQAFLPWLGMCIIVLPIIIAGMDKDFAHRYWNNQFCPLVLLCKFDVALRTVTCFLPSFLILILCIVMTCGAIRRTGKSMEPGLETCLLENKDLKPEHPACFIVPGIVSVLLVLPRCIYFMIGLNSDLITLFMMNVSLVLKSAILPLLWLLIPDIREEIKTRLTCRSQKKTEIDGQVTCQKWSGPDDDMDITMTAGE